MSLTGTYVSVSPAARNSGIALVLVLWMLVLLTAIANGLVFSTRAEILVTGNLASQARAEALADAGVFKAIHALQSAQPGQQALAPSDPLFWRADGLARSWLYRNEQLYVTIIDETGKIDLNTAPPPLLQGLLRSVGVEDDRSQALVDAILDWRDPDSLRRLHGAEKDDYVARGLLHGPPNSDFENIDELRQVLGMNESLFNRIEPYITVFSHQGGINSSVAPKQVLLSVPGVAPEQVDLFVAQRTALLEQGFPPPPFPPAQGFSASSTAATFSIHVDAFLSDNSRFSRQAVVRLTSLPKEPYSILAWRAPISLDRETRNSGIQSNVSLR
jgi:general secretion pathway protein K